MNGRKAVNVGVEAARGPQPSANAAVEGQLKTNADRVLGALLPAISLGIIGASTWPTSVPEHAANEKGDR